MTNCYFNDDMGAIIDRNLTLPGIQATYHKNNRHEWILKVGNESLRDALNRLTKRQLAIIEGLLFEGLCLEDICRRLLISREELLQEIRGMKITLTKGL